jgi:DNA-binding response OmpR family regulator
MPVASEVLVVEDEPDIRNLIALHLTRDGFRCRTAGTGLEALQAVRTKPPDLVILDLMLPEMNGLEICRRLRQERETAEVPIIMLTAKIDEVDRVLGLEMGADDYVAKPFSPKELVARVRAVLRRTRPADTTRAVVSGALMVDPSRHVATLAGQPLALTPKEFDLLQAMLESAGRVLSREHLLYRVWGYSRADEIESRTIDVHVRRLRAKLGEEGRRITTVKSIGYRLEEPA